MKHLKKTTFALVAALGLMSAQSHAALMTTSVQTQTYTGPSGSASGFLGLSPFVFNKFDSALGTLSRVIMRASFTISGGLISADNMSNQQVSGNGFLGASAAISEPGIIFVDDTFNPMFEGLELTQFTNFTLAADPTMGIGGTGPDVVTFNGSTLSTTSGWKNLASFFQSPFVGTSGQTLSIGFDTNSEVAVNVVGARGSFENVENTITLDMYYEYNTVDVTPPPTPVSAPLGFAALGLGLIGFAARRKQK